MGKLLATLKKLIRSSESVTELAKSSGLTKQCLYKLLKSDDIMMSTAEKIIRHSNACVTTEPHLPSANAALDELGKFPSLMQTDVTLKSLFSLEKVLAASVDITREDQRVFSVWVSALLAAKNVDFPTLVAGTPVENRMALGFLIDCALLAGMEKSSSELALQILYTKPASASSFYKFRGQQWKLEFLIGNDHPLAKKWGFVFGDDMDHHITRWKKFLEMQVQQLTSDDNS